MTDHEALRERCETFLLQIAEEMLRFTSATDHLVVFVQAERAAEARACVQQLEYDLTKDGISTDDQIYKYKDWLEQRAKRWKEET